MHDEIKAIIADVLGVEADMIDESASMETIESWDSLAQINIVAALEQRFGVTFEVSEIETMLSYPVIVEMIESRI
jgi:acyl carrier protein